MMMRFFIVFFVLLVSQLVASYPTYFQVITADSPTSYWRLDEASGNFVDLENGAHTCVPSGGVTYNQTGALLDGTANPAVKFNGTDGECTSNFATTAGTPQWPDGSLDVGWSVETWYKPTNLGALAPLVVSSGAAGHGWGLFAQGSGEVTFQVYGQGTGLGGCQDGEHVTITTTGANLTVGNYSHIVVTTIGKGAYTSGNGDPCSLGIKDARIYINGQLNTSAATFDYSDHDHCECVGNLLGHQQFMEFGTVFDFVDPHWADGTLDEVSFYGVALTPAQVLCHYDAGIGTPCGTQLDWPFTAGREQYGSKNTPS